MAKSKEAKVTEEPKVEAKKPAGSPVVNPGYGRAERWVQVAMLDFEGSKKASPFRLDFFVDPDDDERSWAVYQVNLVNDKEGSKPQLVSSGRSKERGGWRRQVVEYVKLLDKFAADSQEEAKKAKEESQAEAKKNTAKPPAPSSAPKPPPEEPAAPKPPEGKDKPKGSTLQERKARAAKK